MKETVEQAAEKREIEICQYSTKDCLSTNDCHRCQWGVPSLDLRCSNNASFKLGAQWQSKQSPWISVEERTPETDDDLYFVLDTTMTPPGVGLCDFDVNSRTWVDNYHLVVNPTHWMPIPE